LVGAFSRPGMVAEVIGVSRLSSVQIIELDAD